MSRSLKKGPFVDTSLLQKIETMNRAGDKKVVKTWSRASVIFPDFIGQALAGLTLTYTGTIRPGEYVRVGEHEGTVTAMGAFTTRIRTGLGEELILPNSMIATSVTNVEASVAETAPRARAYNSRAASRPKAMWGRKPAVPAARRQGMARAILRLVFLSG